jgi:hypothetical protein
MSSTLFDAKEETVAISPFIAFASSVSPCRERKKGRVARPFSRGIKQPGGNKLPRDGR